MSGSFPKPHLPLATGLPNGICRAILGRISRRTGLEQCQCRKLDVVVYFLTPGQPLSSIKATEKISRKREKSYSTAPSKADRRVPLFPLLPEPGFIQQESYSANEPLSVPAVGAFSANMAWSSTDLDLSLAFRRRVIRICRNDAAKLIAITCDSKVIFVLQRESSRSNSMHVNNHFSTVETDHAVTIRIAH